MTRQKTTKKTTVRKKSSSQLIPRFSAAEDLKNAALLVSITINLAFFIGWLALKITTDYDEQVAQLLFSR